MFLKKKIYYVGDSASWVINEIGKSLERNLIDQNFKVVNNPYLCFYGVRHFGDRYRIGRLYFKNPFLKNIVTYFHGDDSDTVILNKLKSKMGLIDKVHTSCRLTKEHLVRNGIPEHKIVIIPIGIEVNDFSAVSVAEKLKIRKKLGIADDSIVIGSFQKDGSGWGEGLEPKLCKGPDLFCEVMEKLNAKYPIHVLLSGPSRGYVKKRLKESGIKFKYIYLEDYKEVARLYNALDLYLVASRLEGGPRAPMESQASGIPVVSTNVGQVEDVIKSGENGFIVEPEDIDQMVKACERLINDKALVENIVSKGLKTVRSFDYTDISKDYMKKLYT